MTFNQFLESIGAEEIKEDYFYVEDLDGEEYFMPLDDLIEIFEKI